MAGERVFIIVDGSNFYHRLKEVGLLRLLHFDYEGFVPFLAGKRDVVRKRYYIGAVREERDNPKSRELMRDQRTLIGKLRNAAWEIGFGHMLKADGYHEKGVDVLIAVDLLVGAYEDRYDAAVLVSSDTDLLPAIAKIRSMGKSVEYIGFSHKPSFALIANTDVRRLLTLGDLERFLTP